MAIQSHEIEPVPDYYGIPVDSLSDETWQNIQRIYYSVAYPNMSTDEIEVKVNNAPYSIEDARLGLRLRSELWDHAKLYAVDEKNGLMRFNLDPNIDDNDPRKQQLEEMKWQFREQSEQLLLSTGLAQAIYKR